MPEKQYSLVKIGPGSTCVEFVTGELQRWGLAPYCSDRAAGTFVPSCKELSVVELRFFREDGLKVTTRCYCRSHLPKRWRRLLKAAFG